MAELVDALVSGTSAARRGGSSPLLGTKDIKLPLTLLSLRGFFMVNLGFHGTFHGTFGSSVGKG